MLSGILKKDFKGIYFSLFYDPYFNNLRCKLSSMSCQDQYSTNTVQKPGGNTKNKSQPCDTEEILTWQITGIAKMNALKEIRDKNRPKNVNNK